MKINYQLLGRIVHARNELTDQQLAEMRKAQIQRTAIWCRVVRGS